MPCELKGFRGLDISKGSVSVLGESLLECASDLYHPNDIFLVPASIRMKATASRQAGTGFH